MVTSSCLSVHLSAFIQNPHVKHLLHRQCSSSCQLLLQVFARSAKFSLFDPAKEMVYIEMSKEEKSKGKAAVDLLGSQIGKSG